MEMIKNTEIISTNLRNLRQATRCQLKILAEAYGVTPYFIKKWESGKGEIPEECVKGFAQQALCTYDEFCSRIYPADEIAKAKIERGVKIAGSLYLEMRKKQNV